ncbi:MAG: trimeric autotransporter adhesin [Blastocatellia bacterium]|nr:trimeric autotransporter adhesin [Blastocatellia bacterium]
MNRSIRFSVPTRLRNHSSRRFVARHLTLVSVLLVLGVAVSGLSLGRLWAVSSAGREAHQVVGTGGESPVPAPVKASNAASMPALVPATTTVNAGPDTDAANNDYRRIQNAINAAASGDTIILNGTFDFTQPFAAAAWALGNDNTAGTADDYEVLVPVGLNNITLTANSLGAATIQGPGDLPAVNREGFLIFDSLLSGPSPSWTISNLRILDFDFSIGMFAVGVSDFNNTTIQNNFIRIPTDLNATVAPADSNPNVGINFSFGTNQSILGNTFNIPGDGVSDGANTSSNIAMQSTVSSGNVYDGLTISNNVIHVLNAQSANPEVIVGIWENGSAHTSNITISNNSFINDAVGNNPGTNLQRGFRVTSHSSATTTVTYSNNTVNGANIGFEWLAASNFAGNQAVKLTSNTITNGATGVLVQSQGLANLSFNRIVGNSVTGANNVDGTLTAENNWWGCNAGPGNTGCDGSTGTVDFNPWLVLGISASPANVIPGGTSTATADMTHNSDTLVPSATIFVPPTGVTFGATQGTMAPPTGTLSSGQATSLFTSTSASNGSASATVDNQTVSTPITVLSPANVSGTKTVSGTFAPNGSITYTVVLSNSGPAAQLDNPGNEFTDVLPSTLTLVSANATSGTAVATVGTRTVTWDGTITASGTVTITISATINSNAGGTTISNQGSISYDADGTGTNEASASTDDPSVGGASDPTSFFVCGNSVVVTANGNSGAGSLRQAILDACPGATITFNVTSPITLSSELVIDKNLTIQGPTSPGLTISGGGTTRIFNISAAKSLSFSNLTIANGKATTGGGILNAGTLTITNSTLSNNSTPDGANVTGAANGGNSSDGGSIYNTGTLTLINSTLSGNQTGNGGNNTSGTGNGGNSGNGGAVYNTGAMQLTNSTVANNKAGSPGQPTPDSPGTAGVGGGIFTSGTLLLNNTIVATNADGFLGPNDINGAVNPSSASNLIGSNEGLSGISNGSGGNQIGTTAIPLSPHLGPLADNGGPTKTHLPDQFSTAIDGGDNTKALDQNNVALATDQRGTGFPRKIDGGGAKPDEPTVDIGAVEVTPTAASPGAELTVVKTVDRDTVVPDRDLTYTIVITNSGADTAVGATMEDKLPLISKFNSGHDPQSFTEDTQFVSLTKPIGSDWSCSTPAVGSGGSLHCTKPTGFNGTSMQTFTLVVHVPSDAITDLDSPFISNSVSVDATNDTNTENNSGFATTQLVSCVTDPIVTTNSDSGAGSLRQAIADACAGSTITFDTTPGHVTSPITLTSGELLINKGLTIHGPGASQLTVSGNNTVRVFNIQSGNTVTVSNLTIANGKVNGATNGGGLLNGGALTLINCNLYNSNTASSGGGIYSDGTSLTLTNCNVGGAGSGQANSATFSGAGIFNNSGSLTITGGSIVGNGAGATGGGGIQIAGGTATLNGVAITQNHAFISFGGGIGSTGGTTSVINSLIAGNTASRGGAIYNNGGAVTVVNSTISGNTVTGSGGGVRNDSGTFALTNVTLTNNRSDSDNSGAEPGGGILRSAGTVTLKNTLVAGNFRGTASTADDINGAVDATGSFNLVGDGTGMTGISNLSNGNQVGASGSPINAMLSALASNGGATQTHLLFPGSPAINAGSNALAIDQSNAALTTDQRGTGFNRIVNSTVDIGAVEVNYSITATAGTPQSAVINSAFATALKATVKESGNNQSGIPVTFTAPGSGASGTFSGSATVNTDASGVATAPAFTANGTAGGPYNVIASLGTGLPIAAFALTNTQAATSTAVTASPNPSNSGQSVTFTATVTSTAGTPTGTVQFKDGGASIGSPQALNGSGVATFSTSSLTAGIHTITADYSGDPNFIASTGTLSGGQQVGAIIRFSSATYNTTESSLSATITVQRSGELTSAVSVDYATPDDSAAMTILPCSTPGFVSPRCDFTTAIGTLKFAANETSKTFEVLISQDNYVEGSEQFTLTLSNVGGNAALGAPSTATLTIADDVTEPAANPIDDSTNFVRQHYHDFLNREPLPADAAGLNFWVNQIESCGSDQACRDLRKVNVSGAFFLSIEFQQSGYYVYRTYKTAFGDINPPTVPVPVRYREFTTDTKEVQRGVIVGQGAWQAQLDANKQAYALAFVARSGFQSRYPAGMTAAAFVDALNANAGNVLTPTQRADLISELTPNPADSALRADVLMKIAENALLKQQEMNRSFVLMQYFGYLRRNPDAAPEAGLNFNGFNFWLNKLNSFNGNFVNADMVKAFITSGEYRGRFGQ